MSWTTYDFDPKLATLTSENKMNDEPLHNPKFVPRVRWIILESTPPPAPPPELAPYELAAQNIMKTI